MMTLEVVCGVTCRTWNSLTIPVDNTSHQGSYVLDSLSLVIRILPDQQYHSLSSVISLGKQLILKEGQRDLLKARLMDLYLGSISVGSV